MSQAGGQGGAPAPSRIVRLLFSVLLRLQPRVFREAHGEELIAFYHDAWRDQVAGKGTRRVVRVVAELTVDALRSGLARRMTRRDAVGQQGSDERKEPFVESWVQDVRWSLRSLVKRPGFVLIVILTLALGVGANTAVFGVLNAVLLTPLPYPESDRLVRIYQSDRAVGGAESYLTQPALVDLRANGRTLDVGILYTYREEGADLTQGAYPERVRQLRVSAGYFDVLRAQPLWGRVFRQDEETADARVVVISRRIEARYFGGGNAAVGGTLSVDGLARTVVGVLPDDFEDPLAGVIDVWLPLPLRTSGHEEWEWDNHYLSAIGRLRPGSTRAAAQRELDEFTRRQSEAHPVSAEGRMALVVPLQEDLFGRSATMLFVLMAAVALLLLIACVNVASLFLARGAARNSELALRVALGSSRSRLIRLLLSESLVLALAGGAVGVLLALLTADVLASLAPAQLRLRGAALDLRILGFSLLVSLLSGMLFGTAPALQFTRPGLSNALRDGGRTGAAGRAEGRARSVLVVVEFSLALVLLTGAGILLKSFDRLRQVPLNIRTHNVMTFEVHLPEARYEDAGLRAQFHASFVRRLGEMPGVRAVGATSRLPVTGRYHSWGTRPALSMNEVDRSVPFVSADQRTVEGAYFETLRMPLLRGRVFDAQDHVGAPPRAVISEAAATALFGDGDPIGRYLVSAGQFRQVIGVVADVPVTARGDIAPIVYHSHTQFADNRNWPLVYVVATNGSTPGQLASARRELAALDPELVLYDPRPLSEVVGRGVAQERFAMVLLSCFAALAVLLATIGIYGVLAYSVSRRRPEIGIRMALGARTSGIQRMIVGQGARLAGMGIILGLAGAFALARSLSALVFEVSTTDFGVYLASATLLLLVALAASALPAFAATRVNPVETIRT